MYTWTLWSPILAIIFTEEDCYCNIEDRIPNNPYRPGWLILVPCRLTPWLKFQVPRVKKLCGILLECERNRFIVRIMSFCWLTRISARGSSKVDHLIQKLILSKFIQPPEFAVKSWFVLRVKILRLHTLEWFSLLSLLECLMLCLSVTLWSYGGRRSGIDRMPSDMAE
jgi:hypothetical protein